MMSMMAKITVAPTAEPTAAPIMAPTAYTEIIYIWLKLIISIFWQLILKVLSDINISFHLQEYHVKFNSLKLILLDMNKNYYSHVHLQRLLCKPL